jgi:hypothetical protein
MLNEEHTDVRDILRWQAWLRWKIGEVYFDIVLGCNVVRALR